MAPSFVIGTILKEGEKMIIRLGYVAIALKLPKVTSSSTVTYTNFEKLSNEEAKLNKLKAVTLSNLNDLKKILEYNIENNIHFYRITSALVPLATHPEVSWNYRPIFKKDFINIGALIKKHNMRVDTHPDEFNVINSLREDVVENTKRNLWHHVHLFEDLEYPLGKMVIHIGSSQGGKDPASKRFISNFKNFPREITSKLMLENDDKTFTAKEVLHICQEISAPMVLDVHHHLCNNTDNNLSNMIHDIFHTWENEALPPKFHFSSPKDSEKDRKHADFIDAKAFIDFIEICKSVNKNFDVMIEAKSKDLALYKLVEDIKLLKPEWKWIDSSSFEL